MRYTVTQTKENGQAVVLKDNLKKAKAMELALAESEKGNGNVFVEFYRKSDSQRGFLNPDGNHSPNGQSY